MKYFLTTAFLLTRALSLPFDGLASNISIPYKQTMNDSHHHHHHHLHDQGHDSMMNVSTRYNRSIDISPQKYHHRNASDDGSIVGRKIVNTGSHRHHNISGLHNQTMNDSSNHHHPYNHHGMNDTASYANKTLHSNSTSRADLAPDLLPHAHR